MPKRTDPEVRSRALRLLETHGGEYSSLTAAAEAIAKQVGVGQETVRRWAVQAQVDAGAHSGTTSKESAEIKRGVLPGFLSRRRSGVERDCGEPVRVRAVGSGAAVVDRSQDRRWS